MKKVCAFALALISVLSMNVSALAEKSETQAMIDWLMNEDTKFEFTPYYEKQGYIESKALMDSFIEEMNEEAKQYEEEIDYVFPSGCDQVSYSEPIDFELQKYDGKDAETTAKEKLIACGFSEEEAAGIMSEEAVKILSTADKAITVNTYMKEEVVGGESTLCPITRGEYNDRINEADNTNKNARESASNGSESSCNIDGGTLKLQITCVWDTETPSHIVALGKFAWDTMPQHRGQDFFGVSKDIYTTIDTSSLVTFYQYIVQPYTLTNPAGTVHLVWGKQTQQAVTGTTDVGNNPANGMVMSIGVPSDLVATTPIMGGATMGYNNIKLTGACSYVVNIAQSSLSPTEYLLWATYCHQSKSLNGSISISVPLGASISVEPADKYEKASCAINMHWAG